jgi:hypothetical protein
MNDLSFFESIARDLGGKGQLRLILQPSMAVLLGLKFGIADAEAAKAPFWRRFLLEPNHFQTFKDSLWNIALPFGLALAIDAFLQHLTLGRVRPLAMLLVGGLLVWLPFVVSRGFANRVWRRRHHIVS